METSSTNEATASGGSWAYHPLEFVVRPRGGDSTLARRLATSFSLCHQTALVRHGASMFAKPTEQSGLAQARADGIWTAVSANGQDCLVTREGHFDLPLQRQLLSEADLVVVEGRIESPRPWIMELDPDGRGLEDLSDAQLANLAATFGPHRPARTPPGGVPWFRPEDLDELSDHLLEHLERELRQRPLDGVLFCDRDAHDPVAARSAKLLAEHCDHCFVVGSSDPNWERMGWRSLETSHHPRLGTLGWILSALERRPNSAWLVLDDSAASNDPDVVHRLISRRDPLRTATAYRDEQTHLPRTFPSLWEPKSRARILLSLASGISCPQRILTHARIQLLEPHDSTLG